MIARAQHCLQQLLQADRDVELQARTWLIGSVASLEHASSPRLRCRLFLPCPPAPHQSHHHHHQQQQQQPLPSCSRALSARACQQLLALWCERQPAQASRLAGGSPHLLRAIFGRSDDAIRMWFGHFNMAGIQQFRHGALALANFALTHRAAAWGLLEWRGKHAQAPVAVANKTHYFCELDLVATVHNLLARCPEFWSSPELQRSLEDGQWLVVDTPAVVQALDQWWHDAAAPEAPALQQALAGYVAQESWPLLCQRLLPWLSDAQLLQQAQDLSAALAADVDVPNAAAASQAPHRHHHHHHHHHQHCYDQDSRRSDPGPAHQRNSKQAQGSSSSSSQLGKRRRPDGSPGSRSDSRGRQQLRRSSPPPRMAAAAAAAAAWAGRKVESLEQLQDLTPLLLGGGLRWQDLKQLLLGDLLTCHREQLLLVLTRAAQEDEAAAAPVLLLHQCARQLSRDVLPQQQQQQQQQGAAGALALPRDVHDLEQLLVAAWLLRLSWLLTAAEGPPALETLLAQLGCTATRLPSDAAHQLLAVPSEGGAAQPPQQQQARPGGGGSGVTDAAATPAAAARVPLERTPAAPGQGAAVGNARRRGPSSSSSTTTTTTSGSSAGGGGGSPAGGGRQRRRHKKKDKKRKKKKSSRSSKKKGREGRERRRRSRSHHRSRGSSSVSRSGSSGGLAPLGGSSSSTGGDAAGAAGAAAREEGEVTLDPGAHARLLRRLHQAAQLQQRQPVGAVRWRVVMPASWRLPAVPGLQQQDVPALEGTATALVDQLACWVCRCWVLALQARSLRTSADGACATATRPGDD